jgi:uncharacterized protein YfcZ (UPF0381/DUF406 family)
MEGVSTITSTQSLEELASKSNKAWSWHSNVVSKVAHVESTILLFLNFEFKCLVFWQCKIVHLKVGGKWNT